VTCSRPTALRPPARNCTALEEECAESLGRCEVKEGFYRATEGSCLENEECSRPPGPEYVSGGGLRG
jgi:hypothetical protein